MSAAAIAIAMVCVCGVTSLGAQEAGSARPENGMLRGTVVNGVTRERLGRAVVYSSDNRFAVMTDDSGRFEMVFKKKAVEANGPVVNGASGAAVNTGNAVGVVPNGVSASGADGSRSFPMGTSVGSTEVISTSEAMVWDRPEYLSARKSGFLAVNDGTPGVTIARDQEEVTISLMPEARVVGHVTLAGGEGAEGIQVMLFKRQVQAGRSQWTGMGQIEARSDGEFRFADLGPGSYKLFTQEHMDRDSQVLPRGQLFGYPPVYYPAAADFESGSVIQLAAGQTFQAALSPERKKYYPVRIGLINGVAGFIPEIWVSRDGHEGPGYSLGYNFREGTITGTLPDGNYTVRVLSRAQAILAGTANVAVNGGPATGTVITLVSGSSLDVRVNAEFTYAPENWQGEAAQALLSGVRQNPRPANYIQLALTPQEEFGARPEFAAQQPNDPANEGLVIESVPPGKYQVKVETGIGYVASVRCGDRDLQHSSLEVGQGANAAPIEVTLRDDGAVVDGSVVDLAKRNQGATGTGGYAIQAIVYLVPVREGGEMKQAPVQPNGEFQFPQIAPGSYRVLAFEHPQMELEYLNEEAMGKFDAQVITLVAAQKEHLSVALSGKSE